MDNMVKIRQTLTNSIFEVFERMFYVFLEPADGGAGEYHYRVGIRFSGPLQGELTALFSRPLADVMVKNMLSVGDDEISDQLTGDCLKESLNMVCGNFLSKYDSAKVFDLSIPTFAAGSQTVTADPAAMALNFTSSQGGLSITMTAA